MPSPKRPDWEKRSAHDRRLWRTRPSVRAPESLKAVPIGANLQSRCPTGQRIAPGREEMPKEAHSKAAEAHDAAAKAHRTAAEHHGKGDHGAAHEHSTKAHGHSETAHK